MPAAEQGFHYSCCIPHIHSHRIRCMWEEHRLSTPSMCLDKCSFMVMLPSLQLSFM
ncbi:hypothetical protein DAI22_11g233932 [Oryza sativa Japonica Group]|nr:hypothetical protein DAI22_11g233932 [Oryza sativa Japonica Group]